MGSQDVHPVKDERTARLFTRAVLSDLDALEAMLERDMIERGVRRVGAEQEFFLVDPEGRPAMVADAVLARLDDRFTTELGRFNLEANLPPRPFDGRFLGALHEDLASAWTAACAAAREEGACILLAGILPSLRTADLVLENMSPRPRYFALNEGLLARRGGEFTVFIRGVDQLELQTDSVMLEAANTSFQLHLQVDPETFAPLYNLAQLISAPLVAAAANSPVLLGRRLWRETRIALFERAVDARTKAQLARGTRPRVSFGERWVQDSVLEVFREDAAGFRSILACEAEEHRVEEGVPSRLRALMLHNGTVWRWNRACYGLTDGVPHLRIENRVLPSGPTIADEVANAALFYGLMAAMADDAPSIPGRLPFDDASENLVSAARHGLGAHFQWLDGRRVAATELLLEELLPAASDGLRRVGVPDHEVDRWIGLLRERVSRRQTGAQWMVNALAAQKGVRSPLAAAQRLVRALVRLQQRGTPVYAWEPLGLPGGSAEDDHPAPTVGDVMSTELFTVQPDDVVDLATEVMRWRRFRFVPVEGPDGTPLGLVAHSSLLRLVRRADQEPPAIREIMEDDPVVVEPDLGLAEAVRLMITEGAGCLLVAHGGRLVGLVTERGLLRGLAEYTGVLRRRDPDASGEWETARPDTLGALPRASRPEEPDR